MAYPDTATARRPMNAETKQDEFEDLKRVIHSKLVEKLDMTRLARLPQ